MSDGARAVLSSLSLQFGSRSALEQTGVKQNSGCPASVGVFPPPPARLALSGRVPAAPAPETLLPTRREALGRRALRRVRVLPGPRCSRRHSLSVCFPAGAQLLFYFWGEAVNWGWGGFGIWFNLLAKKYHRVFECAK